MKDINIMQDTVVIKKNPYGDTRTAPDDFSYEKFCAANREHINHVNKLLCNFGHEFFRRSDKHDFTKIYREEEFWLAFLEAKTNPSFNFVDSPWYQTHIHAERHHLNADVPLDVDLIDVIEMICDCVAAGYARKGEVDTSDINEIEGAVIYAAIQNTIKKVMDMCMLEETKDE